MPLYQISITDRTYSSWTVYKSNTLEQITLENFNPIEHKLFNNDVFIYNKNKVEIITSPTRHNENIPAILMLSDNKTYGRDNKITSKTLHAKGKLLYKCIPNDNTLPMCLVPYEMKQLGFSKVYNNMYVTVRFKNWDDKHPQVLISQIIGTVDVLCNFYEYQLYCKNLNISINKFSKEVNKAICNRDQELLITEMSKKYDKIEDRTSWKIFTIDPNSCLDFDDAVSVIKQNTNETLLSIYIANVPIWLEFLNLWSHLTERISTIYLPNNKKPMLPNILSDCLCSLKQGVRRFTFVIDIVLDCDANIVSINFTNALIKVFKNYSYEEDALLSNSEYQFLFNKTTQMMSKYRFMNDIVDSHDVVCYLMILMNYFCATELLKYNEGIFRTMSTSENKTVGVVSDLPNEVIDFIKYSRGEMSASYINIENNIEHSTRHELLALDSYIHITSPIRRIVDLLNMMKFQQVKSLIQFSPEAQNLYSKWTNKMEYINKTTKTTRKIQQECLLLDMCVNKPESIERIFDGYCFDKQTKRDGLYIYSVFLPELKLTSTFVTNDDLCDFEKKQFKLYLFNNEEKLKKKIKLQIV